MALLPGLEAAGEGRKRYLDGTHRVLSPEETLARVLPLAPRLGITRVANLTGLDTLGIPVVAAYRPNSRSIAVFQGKGTTLAAAKASAVMEAAEAWHAERLPAPRIVGRYTELAARGMPLVDPDRLPRAADARVAPREAELGWVEGRDLFTGAPRLVPVDLVTADYTLEGPAAGPLQATTNGLAAGNHPLEAISHGLCEAIERDALALWRLMPDADQDATTLDLETAAPAVRDLVARFAAAGVALRAFDATSDIGVATVLCLAVGDGADDEVQPELGSGCHPDPMVALSRAVTEAAQVRLSRIAGARDDLLPESYDAQAHAVRARAARAWIAATAPGAGRRHCRALPTCAGATLGEDVAAMLARLRAAGLEEAVWVDLTDPDVGLTVVRVVVPGLEGLAGGAGGGYVPGPRARRRGADAWTGPAAPALRLRRTDPEPPPRAGRGTVVFLGPTLSARAAAELLPGATLLPPARQGDLYRAVRAYRPGRVALIDGRFATVPAVWHREILWAIAEAGVEVFGAASMGALRAAELDGFGMTGVGRVYEAYRSGAYPPFRDRFEDDDEVAVRHAPPETGSVALSCAMVDIRATLAAAEADGVIGAPLRDRLAAAMKRLHFAERSLDRLEAAAMEAGGPEAAAFAARLAAGGAVPQKRHDAEALLARLAAGDEAAARRPFVFERAQVWERFRAMADAATVTAEGAG